MTRRRAPSSEVRQTPGAPAASAGVLVGRVGLADSRGAARPARLVRSVARRTTALRWVAARFPPIARLERLATQLRPNVPPAGVAERRNSPSKPCPPT